MAKLNDKQYRFVQEYLIDLNATQAAIRAGYSAKSAKTNGNRLLTNADVQKAVQEGMKARSERTQADSDWVLRRLVEEAEADLADIFHEGGGLLPVSQWPQIWRRGLVAGIDVHQEYAHIDGEKVPAGVVQKIRLSDRLKRIELIGKHVNIQAFKERVEQDGNLTIEIVRFADQERGTVTE